MRLRLLTAEGGITPGDGPTYFTIAHSPLDGNGLAGNDYRTPGYPIAITPALLADRVLGRGEAELVLGAQDLLGVLLAVGMLLVGARYFRLWVGVAAGMLAALSPVLLTLERLTYPDLMYGCGLFAGAVLLAEAAVRGGDRRRLAASGIAFGLTAYVKPAAQALMIAPLLVLLLSTRSLRRAAIGGAVAAAVMLLTMSPWLIHNAAKGTAGMSEQSGLTLFYRAFDDDRYPRSDRCPLRPPDAQAATSPRARAARAPLVGRAPLPAGTWAVPGRCVRRAGRRRLNRRAPARRPLHAAQRRRRAAHHDRLGRPVPG
ncbi:MAG: glycosyltransferase family 39 protein [Thermoleophilaceae bacterium]|nr:glycosyltransferase family 39 protein [Thermoleophilaceae bacterium]